MKSLKAAAFLSSLILIVTALVTQAAHHEMDEHNRHKHMAPEEVAKHWVTAVSTSQADAIAAVKDHMAEDGLLYRDRYVGFGFTWDATNGDAMIVGTVIPGSPVDGVLQPGDKFVSVRGVPAVEENYGKLNFRGKPGEVVNAVIMRGDKEMAIEVARGVIETPVPKADVITWLSTGDGENWAPDEWKLHEVVRQGNVVYVWTQAWDTDTASGLSYNTHTVTRFEFNDAGEVIAVGNLSEDRFQLEQTGWSISR
jgi:hypothetical protein